MYISVTWALIVANCQLVILVCFMTVLTVSQACTTTMKMSLCFTSLSSFLFHMSSFALELQNCNSIYALITCRVNHAFSWKFLKPHMFAIVQDVLFPILSYSQADEELWNTDPYEYIRVKFGKNMSCALLCILLTFISL